MHKKKTWLAFFLKYKNSAEGVIAPAGAKVTQEPQSERGY